MRVTSIKKEYKTTALVESDSNPGSFYKVNFENGLMTCTCPSHTKGGRECKHIQAFKEELDYIKDMRDKESEQ